MTMTATLIVTDTAETLFRASSAVFQLNGGSKVVRDSFQENPQKRQENEK
jgi:hypothetical protein